MTKKTDRSELAAARQTLTAQLPLAERVAAAHKTVGELVVAVLSHREEDVVREATALAVRAVEVRERVKDTMQLAVQRLPDVDEVVRAVAHTIRQERERVQKLRDRMAVVVPEILTAHQNGALPKLRPSTEAHLKDAVDEETGAAEVHVTSLEWADLFQGGPAFTEVAGNGDDVLVKLVDVEGVLPKLRGLWEEYRRTVPAEGSGA